MTSAAAPGAAIVMLIGPGELELRRAVDTLESAFFHEPRISTLVIVDDERPARDLLARLPVPAGVQATAMAHPRRGRGHGLVGGTCVGMLAALAWLHQHADFSFAVKLDTDALVIAPFFDKLATRLAEDPSVGVIGSCWRTCNGGLRDFSHWAPVFAQLQRPVQLTRRPLGSRRYVQTTLRGPRARIRRQIRTAMSNGYEPGAHCLGGAAAVSGELVRRMRAAGYLDEPLAWLHTPLTEDPMLGMQAAALGMRLVDMTREGEPFGILYRGLADLPDRLAARGFSFIHSVKNDERVSEDEIRRYFRERRVSGAAPD